MDGSDDEKWVLDIPFYLANEGDADWKSIKNSGADAR